MNKPNIFLKKSISLICAALIAFGSIPVFGILNTVRADSGSKAEVKTFDFEPTGDGTKTVTSGRLADTQITSRTDTYNMNIWSVTADSEDTENNVLSIKMSDKDTDGKSAGYRVGAMVLNDGMQPYKLVPGEKYTVTMRYKVTNGGTGNSSGWLYFSQGAQTCSPADGTWGVLKSVQNAFGGAHADVGKRVLNKINYGNVNNKSLKDLNGTTVELNKWITFTYTFTARDCGNGNYIALASCVTPKSEILVDDICIAKSPAKAIAFDSNGGTSVKAIFGTGEAEITMPTDPKKGSLEFSGWYTDAALTKKFTLKKWSDINGDSVKLYAKWETAIIKNGDVFDFEGGDTAASGRIGGVQISSYDDETGKNNFVVKKDSTGNGVLEIRFPENAGAHYKNGTFILNKNGRVPELEAGKKYTVTMRVKINSLNQKATLFAYHFKDFPALQVGNRIKLVAFLNRLGSCFCKNLQQAAGKGFLVGYFILNRADKGKLVPNLRVVKLRPQNTRGVQQLNAVAHNKPLILPCNACFIRNLSLGIFAHSVYKRRFAGVGYSHNHKP